MLLFTLSRTTSCLLLASFFIPQSALAQKPATAAKTPLAADRSSGKDASAKDAELDKRLAKARAARDSGDAYSAAQANKQVISVALQQLGRVRLLQGSYPQAVEIFRRSLDFSEDSETRVDLAIAEVGAHRPADAIADATRALRVSPNDTRALTVRGRTLLEQKDSHAGLADLSRAVEIAPSVEGLYQLGIACLASPNQDDKKHASELFAQMVKLAGDSGSLHVLFGRAYRDANDMPSAIREFETAISVDTRTPHAHYFLGLAHLAVNEWKPTPEIRAEFKKELAFYPHDYLANYLLGFLASGERQFDEADPYLRVAAAAGPGWPEPWLYLGLNAYAQEDMKHAEEYLRKAVVLTGDNVGRSNFQIRRAYVSLGRILANSGRAEESEQYLAKARDLQKKSMESTQQAISGVILGAGGTMGAVVPLEPDKSIESAALSPVSVNPFARPDPAATAGINLSAEQKKAIESEETRLRAILGLSFNDLATAEAIGSQYRAALGHYQEAEQWDSSISGLQKNIGLSAFRAGDFPLAIQGLSKALAADRSDAAVRGLLGAAYFSSDDYANAAATISPLGDRAVHDPILGYAWAASLTRLGDFQLASKILQEVEKLSLPPDALLQVGKLWVDLEDYSRATNVFERVLSADPKQPRVHYSAGLAYLRWRHFPEAIGQFSAQLQLTPNDPDTLNGLGLVFLEQGRREGAAEIFRKAVEAHPENGNAQYQLGKLLLDDGKVKDAVAHLELAVKAMPQSDYVHYQLQAAYRKEERIEDADRELEVYKELKARNRQASIPRPSPTPQ